MKAALLLALIGLWVAGINESAANARGAQVSKAVDDLDEAMRVQDVSIVFPTGSAHDQRTIYERVDLAKDIEFLIRLSDIQKVSNVLGTVTPEHAIKCVRSASEGYGVLRFEYKDHKVDDYLISEQYLQSRSTGKCFRQSPWIQRALALWDRNR